MAAKEALPLGSAGTHNKKGSSTCGRWLSGMTTAAYVAAEDTGVLDCSVCFFPFKSPIYQCMMGHAVCSSCRDKLAPSGKCHVCGIEIDRYHRCLAMERLVESIHVTCPNAAYGCDATPLYYEKDDHHRACPHAPLRCPATGCGFLGLTEALLDHFTGVHGWPPSTKARVGEVSGALLRDGFNFVLATDDVAAGGGKYLFLLSATRRPAAGDCGVTVHFVGPKQTSERLMAFLTCGARRRYGYGRRECRNLLGIHDQQTVINLERAEDLSNGLPNPDDCFQFTLPDSFLAGEDKEDAIQLVAQILITDAV